jgi:heterodisulfide reductase subunit C
MAQTVVITAKSEAFLKRIVTLSAEAITVCDQCGTCSGSCPMISEMDVTPSQLMRMVQLGQSEVLDTKTMWVCASCFACTVRDIRNIPDDELAELPQIALVSAFRKLTG